MSRPLRTQLDVIKVYWSQYKYFTEHMGIRTENNVMITEKLVKLTLRRLMQLLDNEWSGTFDNDYKEKRKNGQAT